MANYTPTAANAPKVKLSPLPLQERVRGFTHVARITYDLIANASATANSDTITCTLGTTPDKWLVGAALVDVTTAFAGVANQALGMSVGIDGATAVFTANTSVFSAGSIVSSSGPHVVNTVASAKGTTANSIVAVFTNATAGSPSGLTAGAANVYLQIWDMDKMSPVAAEG